MPLDIHNWWAASSDERYWVEVTGRDDIGADLKAPQANENGNPFWSYSLLRFVQEGDMVFHYDRSRSPQAVVAVSRATGDLWEDSIVWAARGTYARNAGIEPHTRPGLYAGLRDFEPLGEPVSLDEIRSRTAAIRSGLQELESEHGRPLYFPFESGAKRPIRPLQGYLFKLPAFFVDLFPQLRPKTVYSAAPASGKVSEPVGSDYRRPNEETTIGAADPFSIDPTIVERGTRAHAVTQNALADYLLERGITPLSPAPGDPNFDLAWSSRGTLWVAEVKSVTPQNEEKQLRLGLGQLLRYRQLLKSARKGSVNAVLLVEHQPSDPSWLSLCEALDVVIAWPSALNRVAV